MAELNIAAGAGRHKGITRSKKLSTRVDLTPMVDLGFLLITFFVFTTTVSQPAAIRLVLPEDAKDNILPMNTAESTALTIVPMANGKVFYYHGDLQKAEQTGAYGFTGFSVSKGIGVVVRQKQQALEASAKFKRSDLVLIIRPMADASYQSIIDALDEVLINDLKHYSFVDITSEEMQFIERHHPAGVF